MYESAGTGSAPHFPDAYTELWRTLRDAFDRSAVGKGRERHATAGQPFVEQTICTVLRQHGEHAWDGQVVKKMLECDRLEGEAGDRELLDAIVYLAARVVVRRAARTRVTP